MTAQIAQKLDRTTSSSMFTRLPDELNEQILRWVQSMPPPHWDRDKNSLNAMCRTNRRGHRLATPFIYEAIGSNTTGRDHDDAIESLYGHHVKCLDQHVTCESIAARLAVVSPVSQGPVCLMDALIASKYNLWRNDTDLRTWNTHWIAFMITLCPRITRLVLRGHIGPEQMSIICRAFTRPGIDINQRLIQEVEFEIDHHIFSDEEEASLSLISITPILHKHSLRDLTLKNCGCDDVPYAFSLAKSLPNHLERLDFKYCFSDALGLAALLAFSPKLRYLSMESKTRQYDCWRRDWRTLGRALRKLKRLEHLKLDHDHEYGTDSHTGELTIPRGHEQEDEDDETETIGSLRKLRALETLTTSSVALFGDAVLDTSDVFNDSKQIFRD